MSPAERAELKGLLDSGKLSPEVASQARAHLEAAPFVDQVEDGQASVIAGGESFTAPTSKLPNGAKEGDEIVDGKVRPAVNDDTEARRAKLGAGDPGGPIDLASGDKSAPESPYLLSDDFDAQVQGSRAQKAAEDKAALDSSNAKLSPEAGKIASGRAALLASHPILKTLGLPSIDPAGAFYLATQNHPGELAARAGHGDAIAQKQGDLNDMSAKITGAEFGAGAGAFLGPGAGILSALAKAGAAGGIGGLTEGLARGEQGMPLVKRTAATAGTAALIAGGIHGIGAGGQNRVDALRRNPDVGPDLKTAEAGGYQTVFGAGIKPPAPTGRTPGPGGVAEEAADIAPEAMRRTDALSAHFTKVHEAADEAFNRASKWAGEEVDSAPIIKAFRESIADRTFNDGKPIPRSAAAGLLEDMKSFAKVTPVPAARAEAMAQKMGGTVVHGPQVGGDAETAYILSTRQLDSRELESVRNTFDTVGKAGNTPAAETVPLLKISGAARDMRKDFPGLQDLKGSQSKDLDELNNLRAAFGISSSKRLNEDAITQLQSVRSALESYKAPANIERNRVIDDFLTKNPDLKPTFEKLAAMGAAERLRTGPGIKAGTSTAPVNQPGVARAIWNMRPGRSLHVDPFMRALAKAQGGAPAAAGPAGAALGPEVTKFLWDAILKQQDQGAAP